MQPDFFLRWYRAWYSWLLFLYPKPYYERFGEGMAQTFTDLCRDRLEEGRGIFGFVLWMYFEALFQIIKENIAYTFMKTKNVLRIALVTGFLLLIPLIAMQFTPEVNWSLFDFIVAGGLLFGAGLAYELVASRSLDAIYRAAAGIAVVTSLALVWINLAVGFIGSESNPANLMYGGVLLVGIVGSLAVRFEPRGMARTLFAVAFAQALVPMIAFLVWRPEFNLGVVRVFVLNGVFVALFAASAVLFQRASASDPKLKTVV